MRIDAAAIQLFIRNIVAPGIFDITHPGFVVSKFSDKGREAYRREIIYPESMLADIETQVVKKYGAEGERRLYKIGKDFGYVYAGVSQLPTLKTSTPEEIRRFFQMLVLFVAATWSSGSEILEIDVKAKTLRLRFWDYVICSKNGIGHLLGDAGIVGIWAYMVQDPSIEAVQTECQAKNGKTCEYYMAPPERLKKERYDFFQVDVTTEVDVDEYRKNHDLMNRIKPTHYVSNSMQSMVDSGVFKFRNGGIRFGGDRYFSVEVSLYYILEKELSKLKGGDGLLFDVCFNFGKKVALAAGMKTNQSVMDYLAALGFGDIMTDVEKGKRRLIVSYFPWTEFSRNSKFTMFRGMASGLLSGASSKKIILNKIKTSETDSSLSLSLEAARG